MENRTQNTNNDCIRYPQAGVDLNAEPYRGTFQQLLAENVGAFVTVEIGMSTCEIRAVSGYIERTTGKYVVLKNPKSNCRVAADAWAIKTVTFPCCD